MIRTACHARVTRDAVTCHGGCHAPVTQSRPVPSRPVPKTIVVAPSSNVQSAPRTPAETGLGGDAR